MDCFACRILDIIVFKGCHFVRTVDKALLLCFICVNTETNYTHFVTPLLLVVNDHIVDFSDRSLAIRTPRSPEHDQEHLSFFVSDAGFCIVIEVSGSSYDSDWIADTRMTEYIHFCIDYLL